MSSGERYYIGEFVRKVVTDGVEGGGEWEDGKGAPT